MRVWVLELEVGFGRSPCARGPKFDESVSWGLQRKKQVAPYNPAAKILLRGPVVTVAGKAGF